MIDTILIDLDDTIFDFKKAEKKAISATLKSLGIEPSEETVKLYSEINAECWRCFERGEYTREEILVKRFSFLFSSLGVCCDPQKAKTEYEQRLSVGHYFIDGAEELLRSLRGKYRVYIASNGTARVQKSRINSSGLDRMTDGIFISELVGANKPSTLFFERVFNAIGGADKERTIIIGDSLSSDIAGGIAAGIHTCWFNPHGKAADTVIPEYEVSSLAEITSLLEKI